MKRTWRIVGVATAMTLAACGGTGEQSGTPAEAAPPAAQAGLETAPSKSPPASASPAAEETTPAAEVTTPPAEQTVTTKMVTETKRIAFKTRTVKDSSLAKGVQETRTHGVAGVRTLTYQVTLTDGRQTARTFVGQSVTKKPVTKVVAVRTKAAEPSGGDCDPNYSGACVPIASDVDCAGGGGNGPAYVRGPVRVVGDDIYDLDRDGDGTACD
jgi:hypothetical protein